MVNGNEEVTIAIVGEMKDEWQLAIAQSTFLLLIFQGTTPNVLVIFSKKSCSILH